MIATPQHRSHPDRHLHAELALEEAFEQLAHSAERSGWTSDETAFGLLNLALARILAIEANAETDEAIARAWRSVHGVS